MGLEFIAIAVLVVTVVLFITEIIPLPVTAMLGALAMAFFGIIGYDQVFLGFSSDTFMLVTGMLIIGQAMVESGILLKVGQGLKTLALRNNGTTIGIVGSAVGGLSSVMSNTVITASVLPVIDSLVESSKGLLTKKGLYMAMGAAAVLGGNLTLVGSTPQLVVQGILESANQATFDFFTLTKGGIPLFIIGIAYYAFIAPKLLGSTKENNEIENDIQVSKEKAEYSFSIKNSILTLGTLAVCIIAFMTGLLPVGVIAIMGALFLIVARCISLKSIARNVDWSTVVILGGTIGLSAGIVDSGAAEMIAYWIVGLAGGESANPWIAFAAIICVTVILTNIMSNTAIAAIMMTMGIHLSLVLDINVLAMAVGIVFAASICFMTPIGSPPMTLTLSGGYRFIDYAKVGAPLCILLTLSICLIVPLLYGF